MKLICVYEGGQVLNRTAELSQWPPIPSTREDTYAEICIRILILTDLSTSTLPCLWSCCTHVYYCTCFTFQVGVHVRVEICYPPIIIHEQFTPRLHQYSLRAGSELVLISNLIISFWQPRKWLLVGKTGRRAVPPPCWEVMAWVYHDQ